MDAKGKQIACALEDEKEDFNFQKTKAIHLQGDGGTFATGLIAWYLTAEIVWQMLGHGTVVFRDVVTSNVIAEQILANGNIFFDPITARAAGDHILELKWDEKNRVWLDYRLHLSTCCGSFLYAWVLFQKWWHNLLVIDHDGELSALWVLLWFIEIAVVSWLCVQGDVIAKRHIQPG